MGSTTYAVDISSPISRRPQLKPALDCDCCNSFRFPICIRLLPIPCTREDESESAAEFQE